MRKHMNVKPSKEQSIIGFAFGLIFCCIGIFIVIPSFGVFGILWSIAALVGTILSGKNAFSEKGISTHHIEMEDSNMENQDFQNQNSRSYDRRKWDDGLTEIEYIEGRLKKLNSLYEQRLISDEEFQAKKKEILKEL